MPDPDPLETIRRLLDGDVDGIDADALKAALEVLCAFEDAKRVAEMELTIDADPMPALRPGEVVLFGFDGQVDEVWSVPEPRPMVLRRPLRVKLGVVISDDPGPLDAVMPIAAYRRVGESTYVRES